MRSSDMREKLLAGLTNVEARQARYDDRKIADAWVALAAANPKEEITTNKGLRLVVSRAAVQHNRVQYEAFINGRKPRVAWMYCQAPMAGRVQVTNANVYEIRGTDYRRRGIGTALYDLIERDVQAAGGECLEPHWGSLSDEAIAFWKQRRPDHAANIDELNGLYPSTASGLFD